MDLVNKNCTSQLKANLSKTEKNWLVSTSGNIYLFKISDRNTRKRCEICVKLTIKTQLRHHFISIKIADQKTQNSKEKRKFIKLFMHNVLKWSDAI